MNRKLTAAFMGPLLVATVASDAVALEQEYVPTEVSSSGANEGRPDGWAHALDLGAAIQISGSHQVPGQLDGASFTLSLQFAYLGELWRGNHELRTSLSIVEAISRTPLADDFVKSTDNAEAEAIYYYHLPSVPWFGPFARAHVRTSLFQGIDVRGADVTYLRDGEAIVADRLRLTDAFSPTYLKQSVGVFARPMDEEALSIDVRLGVGARETFADGSYVIADDAATPEIEVAALQTYAQAGGEFALELAGSTDDGDVTYGANYEMLVPFYDSIDEDLDPVQATNYEIGANFGARLSTWSSVQYQLSMLKVPQIVDDWQVTNMLLLSFNYGLRRGVGAE